MLTTTMIYAALVLVILLLILIGLGFLIILLARKFLPLNTENMKQVKNSFQDFTKNINSTLTMRSIIIAIIALVMLIPLALLQDVVNDRNGLYRNVLYEIANTWGGQQTLQAPILVIPFIEEHVNKETTTDEYYREKTKIKKKYLTKHAVFLPRDLNIDVNLVEQHRKRGIYNSLVYEADIAIQGSFKKLDVASLSEHIHRIDWDKAFIILGLTHTRAINKVTSLYWNTSEFGFSSGTNLTKVLDYGFHAKLISLDKDLKQHVFKTKLSIKGSERFNFAPFGENTIVNMHSSWPHPSFQGMTLPTTRDITEDGFNATWSIPNLARNFPQSWVASDENYNLNEFIAGVDLFEPVFLYSKITRAVKYGLLFVALTFLTFLIFELTTQTRLHFIQYGLIGIALSLFYLVLLAVAEHTTFLKAYIIAATLNIGLISIYTASALKDGAKAIMVFTLLCALYGVMYSLLQLEDYALLMGTILLLFVLSVLMYLTRNLRQNIAINSSKTPL